MIGPKRDWTRGRLRRPSEGVAPRVMVTGSGDSARGLGTHRCPKPGASGSPDPMSSVGDLADATSPCVDASQSMRRRCPAACPSHRWASGAQKGAIRARGAESERRVCSPPRRGRWSVVHECPTIFRPSGAWVLWIPRIIRSTLHSVKDLGITPMFCRFRTPHHTKSEDFVL